jgi:squalene-hopene/tetraprenyl-beta-curcumene cyclase
MKNRKVRLIASLALGASVLALPAFLPLAGSTARAQAGAASAHADVQATIDKATTFLKSQQQADGTWQKTGQPPAFTAIALKVFVQDPKFGPNADFVKKGYDKLIAQQQPNGSIAQDLLDNYNTAIAVSSLSAAKNPAYKEAIDKGVAYLKGIQWTDKYTGPKGEKLKDDKNIWWGGWGYGHGGRPDLSNSQFAMEALQNAGLSKDDPAFQNALKFITRSQNNSETNNQKFASGADDGGFIYSPANEGESPAGIFMGADGKRVVRSYGAMTYAGLKSMIYAGLTKDDPRVKAAWKWISNTYSVDVNPGFLTNDPKNGDMSRYGLYYYYHTMARALNMYDEPIITDAKGVKHDWRVELADKIASLQKPDGSWEGQKRWMEDNSILATSFATLALQEIQKDLKEHPVK